MFEAWPYSTGIGGGLQIAPNGMHVLAEMGLADELIRRGSIAESFDFYSQSGRRLGSLNRNMQARFGQPAVNMCRATLNEVLVNKAWCENVALYFEKRLVAIEDRADRPVRGAFRRRHHRPKAISSSAPTACIPPCAPMSSPMAQHRSTPA